MYEYHKLCKTRNEKNNRTSKRQPALYGCFSSLSHSARASRLRFNFSLFHCIFALYKSISSQCRMCVSSRLQQKPTWHDDDDDYVRPTTALSLRIIRSYLSRSPFNSVFTVWVWFARKSVWLAATMSVSSHLYTFSIFVVVVAVVCLSCKFATLCIWMFLVLLLLLRCLLSLPGLSAEHYFILHRKMFPPTRQEINLYTISILLIFLH